MNRNIPRVLALTPIGLDGTAIAVAACRAGGLGLLDLRDRTDACELVGAASRVAAFLGGPFGVCVASRNLGAGWPIGLDAKVGFAAIDPGDGGDLAGAIAAVRGAGRVAIVVVTSAEEAEKAEAAGAEALIASGDEAGGAGSDESTLILIQAIGARSRLPTWARGGIGPAGAAACVAAGAAGVVLDGALLLARESPIPDAIRARVATWDGGESVAFRPDEGSKVRVVVAPGSQFASRLRSAAESGGQEWDAARRDLIGWADGKAWPAGQDAAFAARLARRFMTVGGIVAEVDRAIDANRDLADELRPLAEGSAMARSHGTRFPILQGPMTRVSDVPAFAEAVAEGGALPFLALAMLRGPQVRAMLDEAGPRLAGQSWGVGLLGFVEPGLRREQVEAVAAARPPFALIAGGRPDQAAELQVAGIATYLHAPSPGLLANFLDDGARRFVLEGRECGGHVGPRSSLVLWEQAVGVVADAVARGVDAGSLHVAFAGGVHDARSAAAAAAMAAPLAALGVKVGVLVGTAYLFTREIVETGAVVRRFQDEAIRCRSTVLLETGPGHAVRVSPTPYARDFAAERRRLAGAGQSREAIREALERGNAGRLRVAAKGLDRRDGPGSPPSAVDEVDQYERGTYMLGQAAALRTGVTTVADLHAEIAGTSARADVRPAAVARPDSKPSDVAIVGMSAIFPGAADLRTFWENTLRGVDSITEIPGDRWDWRAYYDPDPKAPDKIVSKWGGFVPDVAFDPLRYGMPPASLPSIEPAQLLALEAVRAALDDAGYAERPFPRERTAVVLGMGGGAAQLAMGYAFRSYLPMLDGVVDDAGKAALEACRGLLPEWTEDSFPGFLLNVAAGRISNRFDLGGANYTVDAACGSSLAAAALAVRELETGAADVAILGGVDTVQNPFTYLAFSKTQAFSPRGRCRPFDASADGIVISEGVAAVVLKRLADAERDGDRIYAVVKGLGSSSDGRARGLTAPSPAGQERAVRRAYEKAGVDPATVGYVEAHGTGTAVGDVVEVNAIAGVFRAAGAASGSAVIGSVKSMIGHTKCAAGMAGLINAALALHHRVLPPTIGVDVPNPKADLVDGPFRVNPTARPWLHADAGRPRRAGVSAFGFGGTNFHAVLEAYDRSPAPASAPSRSWPAELFAWRAADRAALTAKLRTLADSLDAGATPELSDLSHATLGAFVAAPMGPTLAVVATDVADLRSKLSKSLAAMASGPARHDDPRGVHFAAEPEFASAPVAFLFPGQGSQAVGMLRDLAVAFGEARDAFDAFDAALVASGRSPVGPRVFPPHAFDDRARDEARAALTATDVAQPAVGAASAAMLGVLRSLGIRAGMVAGHSYGELVALHAAGAMSRASLATLSEARGRLILEALGDEPGAMAALAAGPDAVAAAIEGVAGVAAVNWNGPNQTVIAGRRAPIDRAVEAAEVRGIRARRLSVACAFHSPLVAGAGTPLAAAARAAILASPTIPVYSNLDASPHPADPAAIADRLGQHLAAPVRFAEMIGRMHGDGARVFIEVGPGSVLSPLVGAILDGRPHLSVSCDAPGRDGIACLLHAVARLLVAGVEATDLTRLTADRSTRSVDPLRPPPGDGRATPSASTWLVNGSRARPIAQAEPRRLGQSPEFLRPDGGGIPLPEPSVNGKATHARRNGDARPASPPKPPAHSHGTNMPNPSPQAVNPTPTPAERPPAAPPADSDRVMAAFQETMRSFLDVQKATMLAYLAGRGAVMPAGSSPARPAQAAAPPAPMPATEQAARPPRFVEPAAWSSPGPTPPALAAAPAPVAKPAAVPAPAATATPTPAGRDAIAATLVEIVRDRTGYPAEMLEPGLDLEADLGIDSIKRVEILGKLRDAVPGLESAGDSAAMDALSRARTLGAIVDTVERLIRDSGGHAGPQRNGANGTHDQSGATNHEDPPPSRGTPVADRPPAGQVRRMTLEAVDAEAPATRSGLAAGGVVLVTDDGRGVAEAVRGKMTGWGHRVVRVGASDLSSPEGVEAILDAARGEGPLAAIVHALPLREAGPSGLDPAAWAARMGPEVRGLFLLARAAAPDLERSARRGGAALVAATAMGGSFGGDMPAGLDFFPGQGGVAGLAKTLAREWPAVRVRVVDLDPREPAARLGDRLAEEALCDDGRSEVGYASGRRICLRAAEHPLGVGTTSIALDPGEPVLISGGARGITAAVAGELARLWRPTLLLVGSSPMPEAEDPDGLAGLVDPAGLKLALRDRLRRKGAAVGPADVERAYLAVARSREIRSNLALLRAAGSAVEYAQADVRDPAALARVLHGWRRAHGDPAGLVHGAGLIKDKLLRDKTPEMFDRVLGTKLDGALNLANLVRPEALRFAAFFSSIAGRFGNRGQADYAAANEVLNKLALWLDRRWSGRVVSMIWGPWSGVGMVSDLESVLGGRGLGMIPPAVGTAMLADELRFGRKGDVEVVVAGSLGGLDQPAKAGAPPAAPRTRAGAAR